MSFDISTRDGLCMISIEDRFDESNFLRIREACHAQLTSNDITHLHIDLSRVRFINSSGLGTLVWLRSHACEMTKTMALVNPAPATQRVLEVANFHRLFDILYAPSA